jgi:hypothetical protein
MPNDLENSLGETGKMMALASQDFVARHLYVEEGACIGICAKFMTGIIHGEKYSERALLEASQWVMGGGSVQAKVDTLAAAAGLRSIEVYTGQLLTDEIYLTNCLNRIHALPSFNIFGFWNNTRAKGHAVLLYTKDGTSWRLYDPNFGVARWPHLGAALLGLKRLLRGPYSAFGPNYYFRVFKYEL